MQQTSSVPHLDTTDTSPARLAAVFGRRTEELMKTGRDAYEAARLAASYAFQAYPVLRDPVDFLEGRA